VLRYAFTLEAESTIITPTMSSRAAEPSTKW
jgi:hypothetical protein